MKRRIGKILLLVILAAVVGVIVYTALTWPVYPDRQKPAESYQQMKQTAEDLGVLAPPEDVLPWTQPEYDFWLDNTWRFARPCGYTMAGDISYTRRISLPSEKPARRTTIRRCGRITKPSPFMSSQAMGA